MNLIHEYSLLVAVALPVVVILGIQAYLFVSGERGTLLLPGFASFPKVATGGTVPQTVDTTPAPFAELDGEHAANDHFAKEAA